LKHSSGMKCLWAISQLRFHWSCCCLSGDGIALEITIPGQAKNSRFLMAEAIRNDIVLNYQRARASTSLISSGCSVPQISWLEPFGMTSYLIISGPGQYGRDIVWLLGATDLMVEPFGMTLYLIISGPWPVRA